MKQKLAFLFKRYNFSGFFALLLILGLSFPSGLIKALTYEELYQDSLSHQQGQVLGNSTADLDPAKVLVVYKINSPDKDGDGVGDSLELANYYLQKRNVPASNLLGINFSAAGSFYYTLAEYSKFQADLVAPIKNKLAQLGPTNINTILLAGDFPTLVANLSVDNALMGLNFWNTTAMDISQQNNPYFEVTPGFGTDKAHFDHALYKFASTDMYMVIRLGGDDPLRGMNQLDAGLYAEKYLYPSPGYFYGNAYVDSRYGIPYPQPNNGQPYTDAYLSTQGAVLSGDYLTYGNGDMNIAYSEHFVIGTGFPLKWENTTNSVSIGDAGAMYSDGTSAATAPRAQFYAGWYNYQKYNDVWDWLPGSIADDLNSGNGFGLGALKHGASAAGYVVGEPYLNGAHRPNIWYKYIMAGYSFGEAITLATPNIGWMEMADGDPLYTPMQPKTPVVDTTAPVLASGFPKFVPDKATTATLMYLALDDSAGPEVAKFKVDFGADSTYGQVATTTLGYNKFSKSTINFASGSVYHYRITLTDPVGNTTVGPDLVYPPASTTAPYVVTQPAANPNPIYGSSTNVSILGGDDGGEANLTYTWSGTGQGTVTFLANGTNAAKATKAYFSKAGSYTLQVVITDAGGLTTTSNLNAVVSLAPSKITLSPPTASVNVNNTVQFSATAVDQYGVLMPTVVYNWSTTGGSITSSGFFRASSTPGGPFTVTVTSSAARATASVTVTAVGTNSPDVTPPTVPTGLVTSSASSTQVSLSWVASSDPVVAGQINSGVSAYQVFRCGGASCFPAVQIATTTSPLFNDTNLAAATAYGYAVKAVDVAKNVSSISAASFVTTLPNAALVRYPRKITQSGLEGLSVFPASTVITVNVVSPATSAIISTQTLSPDVNGAYYVAFDSSMPNVVNLRVKLSGYLSTYWTAVDTTVNSPTALVIPKMLAGDFNFDNTANSLDYSILNSHYNQNYPGADINKDNIVNSLDYAVLKNNYGKTGQ